MVVLHISKHRVHAFTHPHLMGDGEDDSKDTTNMSATRAQETANEQ